MPMDTLPTDATAAAASKTWSVRLGKGTALALSDCMVPLIHWATAGHRKHTCGLDVEMGEGSRSRQRYRVAAAGAAVAAATAGG
jgi:hypothetical protein